MDLAGVHQERTDPSQAQNAQVVMVQVLTIEPHPAPEGAVTAPDHVRQRSDAAERDRKRAPGQDRLPPLR